MTTMNIYKVIWNDPDSEDHVEHLIEAHSKDDAYNKAIDFKYCSYRNIIVVNATGIPLKSTHINPDDVTISKGK